MGRVSIHRFLRFRLPAAAMVFGLALTLGPAGCAVGVGGGGNGVGSRQGTFIDSTVEGLEFNAGGLIGTTNENGEFFYDPGTPVTFMVGDIVVGTGSGAAVMTPVSLSANAVDETDRMATNIASFLMTIDDDRDPSNGIQISDAVREAARGLSVDFTRPASTFAGINDAALAILSAATTAGGGTVSATTAQAHLRATLLTLFSGTYSGDFTGDDVGTWTADIDADGNVTGSSLSSKTDDAFSLTGTVETSGALHFSTSLGPDFTGTIAADGSISNGQWQRLAPPSGFDDSAKTQFGAFTGHRDS
jgi:hypothetical protein